ncbi:hypothetical protein KNP414_02325 [Paenibacillus mucilaginosus KNP414]|uniref:Uncharacterized protein n=1 Tax=Paenibacillus mucilaginosus (strain KNP414) TaxID=1036673 RepID=F8F7Y2_PAEMK|nr:hypothetical protein KNP414_02325 [Paenibacillus mucilaginosus KNP414]
MPPPAGDLVCGVEASEGIGGTEGLQKLLFLDTSRFTCLFRGCEAGRAEAVRFFPALFMSSKTAPDGMHRGLFHSGLCRSWMIRWQDENRL